MISRCFIICFFGIGNLFGHVTSDESAHKVGIEFEIELLEGLGEALNQSIVQKMGPRFPEDNIIRNELCVAAKDYVSFEINKSAENLSCWFSMWITRYFLDPQNDSSKTKNKKRSVDRSRPIFLNYIYCNTIPKVIYLRATDSPNKFVIALKGIFKIMDGDYHGLTNSIKEYSFKMKIVEVDPVENSNATGESEKDMLSMENDDLQGVYKATKFMDWIHICLKARDYVRGQYKYSPSSKLVAQCSPAGLRSIKMSDHKTGKLEDHVAFRCPITPLLYVYFADSKTVLVVLDLETDKYLTLGPQKTKRPFLSTLKKRIFEHDRT